MLPSSFFRLGTGTVTLQHSGGVVVINCWVYSNAKDSSSPMLSIFASLPSLPSPHFPCPAIPSSIPTLSSLLPPSFLPLPPSRPNRCVRLRPLTSNHLV